MQQDLRECIYGVKPWLDLQPAKHALKNEVLLLWGSLAQSARAFENVCFRCMTAEDEGGNTGLQMVMDMPLANVGCTKQAKSTAKWLERLLNRPDCWPFAKGDAGPHAPRLCQLRKIFLVEAKWMEARYLVQPMMWWRANAPSACSTTRRARATGRTWAWEPCEPMPGGAAKGRTEAVVGIAVVFRREDSSGDRTTHEAHLARSPHTTASGPSSLHTPPEETPRVRECVRPSGCYCSWQLCLDCL